MLKVAFYVRLDWEWPVGIAECECLVCEPKGASLDIEELTMVDRVHETVSRSRGHLIFAVAIDWVVLVLLGDLITQSYLFL